jgi:hypothetical protein
MTIKPAKSYFIDHAPRSNEKDLVGRLQMGIALARQDGFDKVYIIESDDAYPADYFERMAFLNYDFVGDDFTCYYHIKNNGIQIERHPMRASLFTTGFRISALQNFKWPEPNKVFVDIELWRHAQRRRLKRRFADSGAVGVKHGYGITGGIGHKESIYKKFDQDWTWLKSKVDQQSLEFYQSIHRQYKMINV